MYTKGTRGVPLNSTTCDMTKRVQYLKQKQTISYLATIKMLSNLNYNMNHGAVGYYAA